MGLVGVIEEFKLQRIFLGVASFGQQLHGLRISLSLGPAGKVRLRGFKAGNVERGQVVRRNLASFSDVIDNNVTINGQGQCFTDAHVRKQRLFFMLNWYM